MVAGIWIISFLAEMPNFIGWGDHVYDRKTLSCVWDRTADLSYSMFFSLAGVAFPVILISICYLKIFLFVRSSKKKVAGTEGKVKKERRESMRLARSLFIIFVVFAVCWTPYAIIVSLDHRDVFAREFHIFSILLAHTNSSLNSILYGLTNQHFRQGYLKLLFMVQTNLKLFCCKCVHPHSSKVNTGSYGTPPLPTPLNGVTDELDVSNLEEKSTIRLSTKVTVLDSRQATSSC